VDGGCELCGTNFWDPSRIRRVDIKFLFGLFNYLEPGPGKFTHCCGLLPSSASWTDVMPGCYTWLAMDSTDPFVGEIESPSFLLLHIQSVKIRLTFPSTAPNQRAEGHLSFPGNAAERSATVRNSRLLPVKGTLERG